MVKTMTQDAHGGGGAEREPIRGDVYRQKTHFPPEVFSLPRKGTGVRPPADPSARHAFRNSRKGGDRTAAGVLAPVIELGFFPRMPAGILYADVVGYCRLTEEDEEGTHRRLCISLDLLGHAIDHYKGTVAHFAGDAVLARFATAGDALSCAAGVQSEFAQRNRSFPEDRRVQFRIGIHFGDVIVDRHDVFGEVVNVSVRLQSLAEPGGICVSEAVVNLSSTQWLSRFQPLGEHRFKNIRRPVRAFQLTAKAADRAID